jgi:retron-type reverse transcriptase
MILNHAYVPKSFTCGIIMPIIKDKRGDATSSTNYRPITISSVISKTFEYFLLNLISPYLLADTLQFGFKRAMGCPNAIFLLRRVIQHFNNNSSNMYIASLDASKAFDRINHFKLFTILIRQGLPRIFLDTLINWYTRLSIKVKWHNSLSNPLRVLSGVRQGGVLLWTPL